jgi:hypothetical protein
MNNKVMLIIIFQIKKRKPFHHFPFKKYLKKTSFGQKNRKILKTLQKKNQMSKKKKKLFSYSPFLEVRNGIKKNQNILSPTNFDVRAP